METKINTQYAQRIVTDVAANMLEVMPGDIWMPMPKPKSSNKLD